MIMQVGKLAGRLNRYLVQAMYHPHKLVAEHQTVNLMSNFSVLKITGIFFWAVMLLFSSSNSFAEGACPPGSYPIGGQGVSGCAPISAGGSSNPQPTGEWQTRWGALAYDEDDKSLGVAEGRRSKSEARDVAVEFCMQGGGKGCSAKVFYKNGCIAVASSEQRNISKSYISSSKVRAEDLALKLCGIGDCKIFYSGCSEAYFKRY
ncbi:DUF4189 domain-containing protein [Xanthomonas cannabis]|uniref:DUF4189 domain-containing protein n=2 Tax=Xanthomonas cannabis TaxID=1885674 RepID=UPI00111245FE